MALLPLAIFAAAFVALAIYGMTEKVTRRPTVEEIHDAIRVGIVRPLGLPAIAEGALSVQSRVETADWKAWYFAGPQKDGKPPTFNLWNRRKGSGRGEWTGLTKFISHADPDERIYTDVYQSARDMSQLLQDPLYRHALAALRAGDARRYYAELGKAGFAASPSYVAALNAKHDAVGLA